MARSKQGSVVERGKKGQKKRLYARIRLTERIGGKTVKHEKFARVRTRSEGREKAKQMLRELEDHGAQIFEGKAMAFDNLAEKYEAAKVVEAEYRGDVKIRGMRSPKSAKAQLKTLIKFFGDTPAGAIDAEMVLSFKESRLRQKSRRGKQIKVATVNRELERFWAVFNFARRKRWLKESPFDYDHDEPLISKADELRRDRLPTDEEEARLLSHCTGRREHMRAIIIGLSDTGMRPSELFRLRWKDVNFDAGVIKLRKETTKTMQPRWIGITERFEAELKRLWNISLQHPEQLVFGIKNSVSTSWETLCKLADVKDLQIRDFRNKTSTDYKLAGIPTELAMKGTGHTQHRTYEGYVKVDQQIARQIAQDLERHRRERQQRVRDAHVEKVN
ncbi:MAG TPA: site-specific integrase [Blastocatellia bacterium]|nr:site-specific integrase [Blastocatellia bacterium]